MQLQIKAIKIASVYSERCKWDSPVLANTEDLWEFVSA